MLEGGGLGTSYCASTLNSSGAAAALRLTGELSISSNNAFLEVSGAPAGRPVQFIFGLHPAQIPFGDGYLCILPFQPGLHRLGAVQQVCLAGGCACAIDFAGTPAVGPITTGRSWYYQFWFRDNHAGGSGSNLPSCLEVIFLP